MECMTLRDYFTKHPNFVPNREFVVIDKDTVQFCGVPLNEECWNLLKKDKLDSPLSESTLNVLRSKATIQAT